MKKFFYLFIFILLILTSFSLISYFTYNQNFFETKKLFNENKKKLIKKILFPHKLVKQQEIIIKSNKESLSQKEYLINSLPKKNASDETSFKQKLTNFSNSKYYTLRLDKNYILEKYQGFDDFYNGINNQYPGSGYLDFHLDNLVILSSRGILAYESKNEQNILHFQQIKNNINEFIGEKQFAKGNWFSLKDLVIDNNKIYVSFTEEIKENCWNTSLLYAEFNYEDIIFKKIFSPKECINALDNIDQEFNAHQSGGRIVPVKNEKHIILTIGDYRSRFLAQDLQSVNGKIIKINVEKNSFEIISMGHRNPQGLLFDKDNNFILSTEHGPYGGDEINLIKFDEKNIPNYGWPSASYGEHYGEKIQANKNKYEKYPLYKSHKDHNFIEPLKYFVPSIGISEIVKIDKKNYVVSSLKYKSLYFFKLNKKNEIVNWNKVYTHERIRDLILKNNYLYLFLEDTASLGKIKIR
mgnify:CR=1 FL=1